MLYINIIPVHHAKGITRKVSWNYYTCIVISKLVPSLSTLSHHDLWNPVIPECWGYNCTRSICGTVLRCRSSEKHCRRCSVKNITFYNLNQTAPQAPGFIQNLLKHDCLQQPFSFSTCRYCNHPADTQYLKLSLHHPDFVSALVWPAGPGQGLTTVSSGHTSNAVSSSGPQCREDMEGLECV